MLNSLGILTGIEVEARSEGMSSLRSEVVLRLTVVCRIDILQALGEVLLDVLVERFERASMMEGTPRMLLRLGRIRQAIVGGCRLGSIGLAEDIRQLEH